MPNANKFIVSVVADVEGWLTEGRTEDDPATAKADSRLMYIAGAAKANKAAAVFRAKRLRQVFTEMATLSAHKAADELNARGIATPSGRQWWPQTVIRVRRRLGQ
jgi:hypothetical protein